MSIFLICRHVVAALPHLGAVAIGHSVHNPACDVLGCGVELQHLVEVFVVDVVVNHALDGGEVTHHAVAVEFTRAAAHVNHPVVAVQRLALTFIVEIELVARRNLQSFFYVIHSEIIFLKFLR